MKVTNENSRIIVEMSPKEAYKVFNFVEFASRKSMGWEATDRYMGTQYLSDTMGRKKADELASLIVEKLDFNWV